MTDSAAVEGLAGAGGAVVALLATYPLLTINTRQQTSSRSTFRRKATGAEAGSEKETGEKTSVFEEASAILNTSGVSGLYSGLKPAFIGTICSNTVYFYLCGYLREVWLGRKNLARRQKGMKKTRQLKPMESLAISSLAGCGNVLCTNPIWILVTRMQASRKKAAAVQAKEDEKSDGKKEELTLSNTARSLYEESGILGFWKGVVPSLIMVSNPSIQYMFFEALKNRRDDSLVKVTAMTAFEVFRLTALAKLGATVITYPMLVVKSNIQNASKSNNTTQSEGGLAHVSIANTIQSILDREGPLGFYKGLRTKIFQSVFAASLLYSCKEEIKKGARKLVKSMN
jgi:adenine nucleotide transporter 17